MFRLFLVLPRRVPVLPLPILQCIATFPFEDISFSIQFRIDSSSDAETASNSFQGKTVWLIRFIRHHLFIYCSTIFYKTHRKSLIEFIDECGGFSLERVTNSVIPILTTSKLNMQVLIYSTFRVRWYDGDIVGRWNLEQIQCFNF